MHFLFIAPAYHTNQHFPVKALLEAGHKVSFLVMKRIQCEEHEALIPTVLGYSPTYDMLIRLVGKCIGKKLIETPSGRSTRRGGIPPVFKLWNEMRRRRPSVVIVRDPLHSAFGRLSVLLTKLISSRLIFYSLRPKHRRLKEWQRLSYSFALWTTGAEWITPVLGDPVQCGPAFERLHFLPFVIPPQTNPEEKRWFNGGTINILDVGKFRLRKNHRLFLEVVDKLSKRYPIRGTIIGECTTPDQRYELEQLKKYKEHLGLQDKVEFKFNLPFAEMQEEYSKHDIFVLPSRDEPMGISLLEAMSHSLPVICSDSAGAMYYIRSGENGYTFRSDDLDDLEICLEKILENRKKLVAMGRRSYELVVTEYSPERYVEALVSLVNPHN